MTTSHTHMRQLQYIYLCGIKSRHCSNKFNLRIQIVQNNEKKILKYGSRDGIKRSKMRGGMPMSACSAQCSIITSSCCYANTTPHIRLFFSLNKIERNQFFFLLTPLRTSFRILKGKEKVKQLFWSAHLLFF